MKGIEADIRKLFQLIDEAKKEQKAERARLLEITEQKFDTIQNAIARILDKQQASSSSTLDYDTQHRQHNQPRRIHIDLPMFEGTDALGWIFAFDQYFDFYRIPEDEQIAIAAIHMTGMAIPWFQMSQRTTPFRSWTQLKRAIEIEFGPSLFKSPRELLFKLHQQGSVTDYYKEFVALANRTNLEPPEALKDCFISGLGLEIKREVKAQCPLSLMRAVSLARLYEDKASPNTKITQGPQSLKHSNHQTSSMVTRQITRSNLPPLLPTPNQKPITNSSRSPVKKLT